MKDLIARARPWILERRAKVLWFTMLVVAGAVTVYLSQRSMEEQFTWSLPAAAQIALGTIALGLAGHIVHCFTRNLPLPDCPKGKKLSPELRSIFVYAYIVQGLLVLVLLLTFVAPSKPRSSSSSYAGFVYGCVHDQERYGSQLTSCNSGSADRQWLLHIGSRSLNVRPDGGNNFEAPVELSRGLVVPLYVVVLAIIGGALGMNRRLPELQRRAAYSYHKDKCRKENDPVPISPIEAREQIVFQLAQLLAAPLIAIVAFSALEPDIVPAAVLIGFASGFSSEPILMKLRAASEAVAGIPPRGSRRHG